MTFNAPDLPVPKVVGDRPRLRRRLRHLRAALRTVPRGRPSRGESASAPMLGRLLRALRTIEERPDLSVSGEPADLAPQDSWRNHLLRQLVDDGTSRNAGWRAALRQTPSSSASSSPASCASRELLDACAERRHVVHGDLLLPERARQRGRVHGDRRLLLEVLRAWGLPLGHRLLHRSSRLVPRRRRRRSLGCHPVYIDPRAHARRRCPPPLLRAHDRRQPPRRATSARTTSRTFAPPNDV